MRTLSRIMACDYRFEFKVNDVWIGAFWKKTPGEHYHKFDLWVCLLPMVPFHLTLMYL